MHMFRSFLDSLPKNRSEMVNDLEIPEEFNKSYVWTEPEESLTTRSDSIPSDGISVDLHTASTDSSMPLSRAMTDSDIDYERYRRFKNRSFSDPWDVLKAANEAFPPGYLSSLRSFQASSSELTEGQSSPLHERPYYNEELRLKMERFFDEECRVFTPDDPGLLELEDALQSLDLKALYSDLDSITL